MTERESYMRQALLLAEEARRAGEVPVGCVIVKEGKIIGRGRNRREEDKNPLAHAELLAMADAAQHLGDWRLTGTELYVTLEPCPMCAGGIVNSRISALYYGAKDSVLGCCGSVLNLFEEDFPHHPKIVGHILEEECKRILQDFFASLREADGRTLREYFGS